jgi:hypothetical protein
MSKIDKIIENDIKIEQLKKFLIESKNDIKMLEVENDRLNRDVKMDMFFDKNMDVLLSDDGVDIETIETSPEPIKMSEKHNETIFDGWYDDLIGKINK